MIKYIVYTLAILVISGCSRWIAPPYTNVEKLSYVQTGMTIQNVNTTLGIEPYDVYFYSDNNFIVIYNYRVKDRLMKVKGDYNNSIHSDSSQVNGEDWYGDKYFCYIYFKDNIVKSIVTDKGKEKSEDILVKNNNLYLIQKKQIGYFEKNDTIIFVPKKK